MNIIMVNKMFQSNLNGNYIVKIVLIYFLIYQILNGM
uniref:Uncharacterized protein n=1 Tax=Anguilla anguilla TaxID=7936 RepID=A0A0E9QZF6_ANGAN